MQKFVDWSEEKNEWLKQNRGISFEEVLVGMNNDQVLDILENPNHLNQRIMIMNFDNYAFVIPYVEDEKKIFLKTIYPSRKYTKIYIEEKEFYEQK